MAGISLSGLVSGSFDWKSVVDQLIKIESVPISRLQTEEAGNIDQLASLSTLKTRLTDLQTASTALSADGLFNGRTATSTTAGSGWTALAANDAAQGSYTISVSQLATAARRNGASGISTALNAAATDVGAGGIAGLTIATLPTATAITAGDFSINGNKVAVALDASLQDVFDAISDATGGVVTASYNATTDKITLASNNGSEIILGASNDSSNFLAAMRLANNGTTDPITSSSALGSAALSQPLVSARLEGGFGAVDGSGNGSFSINGTAIDYNINTDSLSAVLARITASDAGVSASYDRASDRVVLTNKSTGDTGLGVSDTTGGLMSALGLTTGSTLQRGKNAQFTIDGGETISSASNTLSSSALGVTGLSVTVTTEGAQTINVAPATAAMRTAIDTFITKFNAVQSYIDSETKITRSADGQVSAALLSNNREVQNWASELRKMAFSQVSGLTGTVQRLEGMGIDFSYGNSTLAIKDESKLNAALANNSSDVAAFFSKASTGFGARFNTYLSSKVDSTSGGLATQMEALNKRNKTIDEQIVTLNRRLENQRELLTSAFIAMQNAQAAAQKQQTTLTNMFESMNKKS